MEQKKNIPFNKPYFNGEEIEYVKDVISLGKISGNGIYTQKCHGFFQKKFRFKKVLLTTSCTDALEMAAILCNIKPGDEVIVPSYTFVSSALAFVRQGAKIVFADSCDNNPNIDPDRLEELITFKTKVIVPVHYAGVSCDMDKIMAIANKYNILVVEDAAQAIDSYYKNKPLGSIGHLSAFSFHETKNIISGEGGMLVINDDKFVDRAEILWEKGTNRTQFFRGLVNKYGWVDLGSSFLPSEVIAAILFSQLQSIDVIQNRRKYIWNRYYECLNNVEEISLPNIPDYATNNAHMFYIVCKDIEQREKIMSALKNEGINSSFHYLSLHSSPYYKPLYDGGVLKNSDKYTDCLLRLPLYYELSIEEVDLITTVLKQSIR